MDRFDAVAVIGLLSVTGAAVAVPLDPVLASALLAGLVCALAVRRLYDGRLRESLGWLAWLVAAVLVALDPAGRPVILVLFVAALLAGIALQFVGRTGGVATGTAPEHDDG